MAETVHESASPTLVKQTYLQDTCYPVKFHHQKRRLENLPMSDDAIIFHIASDQDIEKYQDVGEYRCASLDSEGFIHCCDRTQLPGVVNRYYQNIDQIQLMLLDPDKLTHPLIRENTVGGSELFPHVYGVINKEAVNDIVPFGPTSAERQGLEE